MTGTTCPSLAELIRAPEPDLERIIPAFVACFNAVYGNPARERWDVSTEEWQRYEFLGDRVLELVVAQALFTRRHAAHTEGEMTRILAATVSNRALDQLVRQRAKTTFPLLIPGLIGEQKTYGERITGGAFEAFIGALYCELGIDDVFYFLSALFRDSLAQDNPDENAIGALQEYFQKRYKTVPTYRQTKRTGPDHKPVFTYEVLFNNRVLGEGSGESTRQAQQAAARRALDAVLKDE